MPYTSCLLNPFLAGLWWFHIRGDTDLCYTPFFHLFLSFCDIRFIDYAYKMVLFDEMGDLFNFSLFEKRHRRLFFKWNTLYIIKFLKTTEFSESDILDIWVMDCKTWFFHVLFLITPDLTPLDFILVPRCLSRKLPQTKSRNASHSFADLNFWPYIVLLISLLNMRKWYFWTKSLLIFPDC